ncbi:MAG: DNA polymerase III subunit delta [Deltaproteobacteria bacterium]|nr:DNA polymerase III subunit delta [Deltaproteobacteria bacterium]
MFPILILVGEDSFLISREISRLKREILSGGVADFNFDRFSAKEAQPAAIFNACATLPMMAERRLVLVSDGEAIKKDDYDDWVAYFENPSPSSTLVLTAEKIDKRLSLWKKAVQKNFVRELKAPFPNQMPPWIFQEAKNLGLKISPEATLAMAEALGSNLMAQISALEKLKTYAMPRTSLDVADVEAVVADFLSKTVFDFTDKVGGKNYKEAASLLEKMSVMGESPVKLLFMVIRHFRLLFLAQEGLKAGLGEMELASQLGVRPFFVKDYLRQARAMNTAGLKKIYRRLLDTDRALKSSRLDHRLVMDQFLMEICL